MDDVFALFSNRRKILTTRKPGLTYAARFCAFLRDCAGVRSSSSEFDAVALFPSGSGLAIGCMSAGVLFVPEEPFTWDWLWPF